MIIFKTAAGIHQYINSCKQKNLLCGFVPTMGAIHQGHLSLIDRCKQTTPIVVVSIFVNPTQFNNTADYEKYPISLEQDIFLLETAGCDALFLPTIAEMYPSGTLNLPQYALGAVATVFEGAYRPGHFQGVCQVVDRLLQIVVPEVLVLGQKDYQQCLIINKLLYLTNKNIQIIIAPTEREPSGLAMSSRNMRLSDTQKLIATQIHQNLVALQHAWLTDSSMPNVLQDRVTNNLLAAGCTTVDYVQICNALTLEPVTNTDVRTQAVVLVAATVGEVRLIDNLLLN